MIPVIRGNSEEEKDERTAGSLVFLDISDGIQTGDDGYYTTG